jgi:hypothetical protein
MTMRILEVDCAGRHFVSFQRIALDPETGEEIYLGCLEIEIAEPDTAPSVISDVASELSFYEE